MRRLLLVPVGLVVLALAVQVGQAGPRVEADPNKSYVITPQAGEWVICASSYMGPDAPELARQLVLVLRGRDNLPAYVFNHADEERKKQQEEFDRFVKEHPGVGLRRKTVRIEEQCAVLIGGFKDDKEARSALDKIKKLPLPELKLASGRSPYDTMKVVEPTKDGKGKGEVREGYVNPLSHAFVTRNPSVPQQGAGYKPDPFWKELNAGRKYSVLNCKSRWTLAIAAFENARVVTSQAKTSSGFLEKLSLGGHREGEGLDATAKQAENLAEVLNETLKIEAYVLHTRTSSILTIGSFDGPEDSRYQRAQETYATLRSHLDTKAAQTLSSFLFPTGRPMEVPKF
jgi:hypothetical protein